MDIFKSMNIAATALTAERLRMDVIANNIANANTTRTKKGGPYIRQRVIFEERKQGGVRVVSIEEDPSPPRLVYDPHHPDADKEGYVRFPNVDILHEMVDMITATRAYEANCATIRCARDIFNAALRIGRF
jgi:flagellar basal-body rod protein FlgC